MYPDTPHNPTQTVNHIPIPISQSQKEMNESEGAERIVVVDCDVLEAAKENVQPLGTGRRVSALSAVLAAPHGNAYVQREGARRGLRADVERALSSSGSGSDIDALEAYSRLVSWTMEQYPQGPSVESGLLELLEEATRVLLHDSGGRWRGEARYLRLWLLYAGLVQRPTVVYRFLVRNEVGTGFALLYEEWAAVLERDGRRKEADEAYKLGIARRAEPVEHLKARYDEFERRMMSSVVSIPSGAVESTVPARARVVLGSRPTVRGTGATGARSNARLQVFVDPTGAASEEVGGNTWMDLETRKTRVKENVRETKKMVGTTVKRTGARPGTGGGGVSAGRIPVFRDPPGASIEGGKVTADPETGGRALGRMEGSVSEMEALRRDPLKNYVDV